MADFTKISIGKDDACEVYQKFGSPTMRSCVKDEKDGYSWFYVSKRLEKNGFLDPKIVNQRTVVITFDRNDIVCSVKEIKRDTDVPVVSGKTKTKGKTKGVFGETFAGLGKYWKRYSKSDK
ncbi:hypothetical protein FACS1894113_2130 [Alphaproteobacteria bacterium]|nr:hypothetical protein FACS1894113_2130 [Alphaproteobacteria bacterium]